MKDAALDNFQIIPEQLSKYLRLLNADSEMPMGYIVNLSPCSLVMVSRLPILLEANFNFLIELPKGKGGHDLQQVEFSASCMWSRKDDDECHYDSGFEIIKSSECFDHFVEALDRYFLFRPNS